MVRAHVVIYQENKVKPLAKDVLVVLLLLLMLRTTLKILKDLIFAVLLVRSVLLVAV
jgi:hypothetical protein